MVTRRSMGGSRHKKSPVTVRGAWFPMPLDFLRSRACAELSAQALKMLTDLCAQLGPNARGNGDLSAAPAVMKMRAWNGVGSRVAALKELEQASLICTTRQGNKRRCALYAITLWPLDCDLSKLDVGPGAYSTKDWAANGRGHPPTQEAPAQRGSSRKGEPKKNASRLPAAGNAPGNKHPLRVKQQDEQTDFQPAVGKQPGLSTAKHYPLRDTFSRSPSGGAASADLPAVQAVGLPGIQGRSPVGESGGGQGANFTDAAGSIGDLIARAQRRSQAASTLPACDPSEGLPEGSAL